MRSDVDARISSTKAAPTPRGTRGTWLRWRHGLILVVGSLAVIALAGTLAFPGGDDAENGTGIPQKEARRPLPAAAEAGGQPSGKGQQTDEHPLDAALAVARDGLERIRLNIRDYTATLIKRERINGKLSDYQYSFVKIRHRKIENGQVIVPFSVYLKFLGPRSIKGREVIGVEGRNNGKILAHEAGLKNLMRFRLDPKGFVAMVQNRYPITEIGFMNLIEQLIKRGERDRLHGECNVEFHKDARVDGRQCTLIQVTHPQRRSYFDFHQAKIFIDDELNIPVQYAAWSWPDREGEPPVLLEEFTYRDVKLNVGLTDRDFDPDNPEYRFP